MDALARHKLDAVVRELGSRRMAADALGVRRPELARWLAGAEPDADELARISSVEHVLSRLRRSHRRETTLKWLFGFNAHLGGARPIDLLARGRTWEVIRAIEADETGAYA